VLRVFVRHQPDRPTDCAHVEALQGGVSANASAPTRASMAGPAAGAGAESDADDASGDAVGRVYPTYFSETDKYLHEAYSKERDGDNEVSCMTARAGRFSRCLSVRHPFRLASLMSAMLQDVAGILCFAPCREAACCCLKSSMVCARENADHPSCPSHSSLIDAPDTALPYTSPGTLEHEHTSDRGRGRFIQGVIVACDAALVAKPGCTTALKLRASANMQLKRFEVRHAFST